MNAGTAQLFVKIARPLPVSPSFRPARSFLSNTVTLRARLGGGDGSHHSRGAAAYHGDGGAQGSAAIGRIPTGGSADPASGFLSGTFVWQRSSTVKSILTVCFNTPFFIIPLIFVKVNRNFEKSFFFLRG